MKGFGERKPRYAAPLRLLGAAIRARDRQAAGHVHVMVLDERDTPRETFVLTRGAYNKPAEEVAAGVPAILPSLPEGSAPNRLALAEWLVSPDHPLTARVTVNRIWQALFGAGIVKMPEDFGAQGALPSHPELLDHLAVEFVESG